MGFLDSRKRSRWIAGAMLLAMGLACAGAAELSLPEYKLKAGYIYNFAKLTTWPTSAFDSCESLFQIGVTGSDPVLPYLEQETKTRLLSGRRVKVVAITNPAEAAKCHLLYISGSARNNIFPWLEHLKDKPVLTVSEHPHFTAQGGMIRLFRNGGSLRFEVRQKPFAQAGMTVSSKLLELSELYPEDLQ